MTQATFVINPSAAVHGSVVLESPFRVMSGVTLHNLRGGAFSYISPVTTLHETCARSILLNRRQGLGSHRPPSRRPHHQPLRLRGAVPQPLQWPTSP